MAFRWARRRIRNKRRVDQARVTGGSRRRHDPIRREAMPAVDRRYEVNRGLSFDSDGHPDSRRSTGFAGEGSATSDRYALPSPTRVAVSAQQNQNRYGHLSVETRGFCRRQARNPFTPPFTVPNRHRFAGSGARIERRQPPRSPSPDLASLDRSEEEKAVPSRATGPGRSSRMIASARRRRTFPAKSTVRSREQPKPVNVPNRFTSGRPLGVSGSRRRDSFERGR